MAVEFVTLHLPSYTPTPEPWGPKAPLQPVSGVFNTHEAKFAYIFLNVKEVMQYGDKCLSIDDFYVLNDFGL